MQIDLTDLERSPVIVSAVRTPIGKFGRSLKNFSAPQLGAFVIKEALERAKGIAPTDVYEVIMGNVVSAGIGQNPARQASIRAGLPPEIGATTVNKVCGSGLKSIMFAAQSIKSGDTECLIAGGMESMSQCPYLLSDLRWGMRSGDSKVKDAMILDGLWDAFNDYHMGITGEIIADKYGVTRDMADEFALESQTKASAAVRSGAFSQEIVPLSLETTNDDPVIEKDECVRPETTLAGLKSLKPVFKPSGVLTAGNSSQLSDGSAAVVVVSEAQAKKRKLEILAKITGYDQAGVRPELIMEAPIPASRAVLKRCSLSINDMDLVEHNEAYSTASIVVRSELDVPDSKFNVNGGAVALGHPLGCSGARLVTTMIYLLRNKKKHRGLVTLCLGGGEAVSMILERPE